MLDHQYRMAHASLPRHYGAVLSLWWPLLLGPRAGTAHESHESHERWVTPAFRASRGRGGKPAAHPLHRYITYEKWSSFYPLHACYIPLHHSPPLPQTSARREPTCPDGPAYEANRALCERRAGESCRAQDPRPKNPRLAGTSRCTPNATADAPQREKISGGVWGSFRYAPLWANRPCRAQKPIAPQPTCQRWVGERPVSAFQAQRGEIGWGQFHRRNQARNES